MRKLFVIAVVLLLALAAVVSAANEAKPDDSLVISIYNRRMLRASDKTIDPTVVKAYSDGRMLWSKNGITGGEPLLKGHVDPKLIGQLMRELDKQGAFEDKSLRRSWVGPDAASTIIEIRDGKSILKMQSWHELFEKNPKLIVTAKGVETLGARSREEVQKAQPEEYKRFRATWDLIRKTVELWTKPKAPQ